MVSRVCFWLPLLAITGCTVTPAEPASVGAARQAIVGGTADTGDPSVVMLLSGMPGSNEGALCTAEVVSPHVLITAAHCVVDPTKQYVIFLGDDLNQARLTDFVDVSEVHAHPMYQPSSNAATGYDIGVVIIASALQLAPMTMARSAPTAGMIGQAVRFIGYGLTSTSMQNSSGVKRQVSTTLSNYNNQLLEFTDKAHNTCEGDSGGPALMMVNGVETIVGVTSFGDTIDCMGDGFDTRVDLYAASFVDPYIALMGKPPLPDMAQLPDGPLGFPVGSIGADCQINDDCTSGICTTTDQPGYCTSACPATACPSGTHCGAIPSGMYCLRDGATALQRGSGGCDVGGRAAGSGALLSLLLLALVAVARRRANS